MLPSQQPAQSGSYPPDVPVLEPGETYATITDQIAHSVLWRQTSWWWVAGFGVTYLGFLLLVYALSWLLTRGIGIWGVDIPVAWGFAIVNFVFFIEMSHAGTFISAVLLLFRQNWRTSINRLSESMTLFAISCAMIFPLFHLGRPWFAFWLWPYPNTMGLWPQWRSPLVWDSWAVPTYLLVSLMFWYTGLVPDLAVLRDRAERTWVKKIYGVLAMGWRGSARHWATYERAYQVMAGIATPLVITVMSVIGMDFSIALVPAWHDTLYPPYFAAGAIYSGFAMVLTLAIPLRSAFRLHNLITERHLDNAAKLLLASAWAEIYCYIFEYFTSWYAGDPYDWHVEMERLTGAYASVYWIMIALSFILPQVTWSRSVRRNPAALWVVAAIVNVAMWMERYIIVITPLHQDFLPSAWGMYHGSPYDWMTLAGTWGLFFWLVFIFIRILPALSISEIKKLALSQEGPAAAGPRGAA